MNQQQEKDLRAMLQAKRRHDDAVRNERAARREYIDAQTRFLGSYARSSPPKPIVCGDTFIEIANGWDRADVEFKFQYREAERCPTSD